MTIADFLLARIAEDESAVRRYLPDEFYIGSHNQEQGLAVTDLGPGLAVTLTRERAIAECEAKKRIVKAWRSGYPEEDRYSTGWHDMRVWTLVALAAVYSGHPDYRPEWGLLRPGETRQP